MGNAPSKDFGPQPEVQILLDPGCVFTAGSIVSGTAIPTGETPVYIRTASIALVGRAVSHSIYKSESTDQGGSKSTTIYHYHHEVPLFHRSAIMSKDAWLGGQQPVAFRFSFTFPQVRDMQPVQPPYTAKEVWDWKTGVGSPWIKTKRVEPGSVYETTGATLALPPSYIHENGLHSECEYAKIEYGIQVSATFDYRPEYRSDLTLLDFAPPPQRMRLEYHDILSEPEVYSSSRLIGAQKSFRNSLKDKLSRQTPSMRLTMGISTPSYVIASKNYRSFDVHAFVSINSMSSSDIDLHHVHIAIKKLQLKAITSWRGFSSDRAGNRTTHIRLAEHESYKTENMEPHYDSASINVAREIRPRVVSDEKVMAVDTYSEWKFPAKFEVLLPQAEIVPTFCTPNISRRYLLEITMAAVICEKTFTHVVTMPVAMIASEAVPDYKDSW